MSRFRYIIVCEDMFHVLGTNDAEVAQRALEANDLVIDTVDRIVVNEGVQLIEADAGMWPDGR